MLVNQLVLTLKNIGETPLATGPTLAGKPQVLVSFVYGNTGGALAPASVDSDSAWSDHAPAWDPAAQGGLDAARANRAGQVAAEVAVHIRRRATSRSWTGSGRTQRT